MIEFQEILFAFLGAVVGAIGVVTASRINSKPKQITAETDRYQAMWDRIDALEEALKKERVDCDKRIEKLEKDFHEEIRILRSRVSDISDVREV